MGRGYLAVQRQTFAVENVKAKTHRAVYNNTMQYSKMQTNTNQCNPIQTNTNQCNAILTGSQTQLLYTLHNHIRTYKQSCTNLGADALISITLSPSMRGVYTHAMRGVYMQVGSRLTSPHDIQTGQSHTLQGKRPIAGLSGLNLSEEDGHLSF